MNFYIENNNKNQKRKEQKFNFIRANKNYVALSTESIVIEELKFLYFDYFHFYFLRCGNYYDLTRIN